MLSYLLGTKISYELRNLPVSTSGWLRNTGRRRDPSACNRAPWNEPTKLHHLVSRTLENGLELPLINFGVKSDI